MKQLLSDCNLKFWFLRFNQKHLPKGLIRLFESLSINFLKNFIKEKKISAR